jgi:hypothetical protein
VRFAHRLVLLVAVALPACGAGGIAAAPGVSDPIPQGTTRPIPPSPLPTAPPSSAPTAAPSSLPSSAPTAAPTSAPSAAPSAVPAATPTGSASPAPSPTQSGIPVTIPIPSPTPAPTSPPTLGAPFFAGGGAGDCDTTLSLTASSSEAFVPVSEPGYRGAFTVTSTSPAVAAAAYDAATSILTILAGTPGTTTVAIADSAANARTCAVTVH